MESKSLTNAQPQKAIGSDLFKFDARDIAISKLLLDPNNYRFLDRKKFKKRVRSRFHEEAVQRATLEALEQSYQLDELKVSIRKNGYVPMERIIVTQYQAQPGMFLVVEGNRRVASLKSILKEEKDGVQALTKSQRESYSEIPCAVLLSSGASLKHVERVIMGIRHIAGPKEWGAYQQALLVSELKDDEGLEFANIGDMLGISSVEAARRYRAVGALKCMEEDELFSRKAEPNFYKLFHELVSLPDVRTRFGWSSEKNSFVDNEKAREFYQLICSDGKQDAKLKTFSDVRKLKFIVNHSKAEDSLFDPEQSLSDATRLGEQGRQPVSASELLEEAKESIEQISFVQASNLKPKDGELIDQLLQLLTKLKQNSPSVGTK